jgi:hypothetical protein
MFLTLTFFDNWNVGKLKTLKLLYWAYYQLKIEFSGPTASITILKSNLMPWGCLARKNAKIPEVVKVNNYRKCLYTLVNLQGS